MSRMTSAQIIGLGEYLNPDFDPASLTVSQLLGVLGFHNINYPSPYTKPKLVQLFNNEIKTRSAKFRKERLKKENSIASDDGITDGLTGQPIGERKPAPARRSSRRLSRAPSQEPETSPLRPDPPKRRRSSAQPSFGEPSLKVAPVYSTLLEESEPEEDELPVRKVGRSKKTSEAAGSQARRVSQPATEDSGWEDNNIFQSGAESSSPLRPSPVRTKVPRKSAAPRKSRKSMSAPPQLRLSSSPTRPLRSQEHDDPSSPPHFRFEPHLPPSVSRETRIILPKAKRTNFVPLEHETVVEPYHKDVEIDEEQDLVVGDSGDNDSSEIVTQISQPLAEDDEDLEADEDVKEDQSIAISRRIATGGKQLTRHRPQIPDTPTRLPLFLRLLFIGITLVTSAAVIDYKTESAFIGYCDTGSKTNNALEELKGKWNAVEACNRENRTLLYLPSMSINSAKAGIMDGETDGADMTPCPMLPLIPLPHPTTCTLCPDHATCTQYSIACNTGYLLRPHPLLFFLPPSSSPSTTSLSLSSSPTELAWKLISAATDGLPWLGSVGLPSRCVEDPKRKRNIGVLGKAIEAVLAQERGRLVCAGDRNGNEGVMKDGDEAMKWGIELETLRDVMKKKAPPGFLVTFDDTFNEAIQQLIQWGGVIIEEDPEGKRYLAHKTPNFTWNCALTVKSREIWAEWRTTFLGVVIVIIGIYADKIRRAQRHVESKRVAELVQIALDTLRHQEVAHHTDPVTAPQPYLSSLQLRDLILQDEHSIPTRRGLWDQVERIVEGNANVRANLEEVHGGDEMRVWRWIGSAGRSPGVRKHVQFDERGDEALGS